MSKKLIIILSGVAFLVLVGMGGAFFLMWSKLSSVSALQAQPTGEEEVVAEEPEPASDEIPELGPVFPMETFIVNLAGEDGRRYLKVRMELEVANEDLINDLEMRKAQMRDQILLILPTKGYVDINTTEGKNGLRNEVRTALNDYFNQEAITNIFFTDFVIQ